MQQHINRLVDGPERQLTMLARKFAPTAGRFAAKFLFLILSSVLAGGWLAWWLYAIRDSPLPLLVAVMVILVFVCGVFFIYYSTLNTFAELPERLSEVAEELRLGDRIDTNTNADATVKERRVGMFSLVRWLWSLSALTSTARDLLSPYVSAGLLFNPLMLLILIVALFLWPVIIISALVSAIFAIW